MELMEHPILFISYSWDDEDHKDWVLNLANRLRKDGVDVILDRYYLRPGKNLPHFVENSLRKSNRIAIILTPNYKKKAEGRIGGVGQEYSLMNNELLNDIAGNERIIPLLRKGASKESIPQFLQQYIYIDFSNDDKLDTQYEELLRDIYKEPKIKMPELGTKPFFAEDKFKQSKIKKIEDRELPDSPVKIPFITETYGEIKRLVSGFSKSSYSERKEKASMIYEISPNIPLREIIKLIVSKNQDENIAAAISLKSYVENLKIDIGANPNVRSFVSYGLKHKSSLVRYRIVDLISVSEVLKKDYRVEIEELYKVEKNKEVNSKLETILKVRKPNSDTKLNSLKKNIRNRLAHGDLKSALNILVESANDNLTNEIILLQNQFARVERDRILGVASLEDTEIRLNKITHSLLSLMDEL